MKQESLSTYKTDSKPLVFSAIKLALQSGYINGKYLHFCSVINCFKRPEGV